MIDSGVDPLHPDLVPKLVPDHNFIGTASDIHDVLGHDTAVAGMIGADTNSGMGAAGLGWNTSVIPIVGVNSINSATSTSITLTVGPTDTVPPDAQVTGFVYDGKNISIAASATDQQNRVTKVEFFVDGRLKATDGSAPWSAKFNVKPLGSESHSVEANGYDSAGNVGEPILRDGHHEIVILSNSHQAGSLNNNQRARFFRVDVSKRTLCRSGGTLIF